MISALKTIFEIITDYILKEILEVSGFRWKIEKASIVVNSLLS